ncbi:hypothetical protein MUP07_00900 [Candidatus Bathyarchaeota archaeon]|nr:hypothetical protein [Candidatus Bathyarchaeota archaeon]
MPRFKAIPLLYAVRGVEGSKMTRTNTVQDVQDALENRARKVMQELHLLQRMRLPTRDKKAVARLKKETEEILRDIRDSKKEVRLAERLQKKSKRKEGKR